MSKLKSCETVRGRLAVVIASMLGFIWAAGCHGTSGDRAGADPERVKEGPKMTEQTESAHHHSRKTEDLEAYIARIEDPKRVAWQRPDKVVAALHLRPGERVADLGCGPGYFTLRFARAVGPSGGVWAIDIEPRMLEKTREYARDNGLENIELVQCQADDPKLPAGVVDTVFLANTYHHFSDRVNYLGKVRAALAPQGRVVVIDFVPKDPAIRGFGPPLEMQLAQETVDQEFTAAGFVVAKVHSFLPEQYFVEYVLPPRVGR